MLERLPLVSPRAYRYITLATLVLLVLITLAGAIVRLTDSGLGCETWPACEEDSFTPESGTHATIEFANRLVSGVVGIAALAAIIGGYRRNPRRQELVSWAWQVLGWVIVNALVGAVVVETDLLPATVVVHFLLAMAAVWSAVVLDYKAAQPDRAPAPGTEEAGVEGADRADEAPGRQLSTDALRRTSHVLLAAALTVVVFGTLVTGAGPHAGDENAERLSLDIGEVARIHGLSAILLLLVTLRASWLAYRLPAPTVVVDRLRTLVVVLVGQGLIGYVQYFTDVPPLLVGAHVLGSALVWIAALQVWLTVNEQPSLLGASARETGGDARSSNSGRYFAGQGRTG